MVAVHLEYEGNVGFLKLITHFGKEVVIECHKTDDEIFRLGGTAVNEVMTYEGVVLEAPVPHGHMRFRAFHSEEQCFDDIGIISEQDWPEDDRHCYVTEYYPLDMEGKKHQWFISRRPIKNAHYLFVNVDIIDGGENLLRRYRISPFIGEYVLMENINV
jgi:hypothetical protein